MTWSLARARLADSRGRFTATAAAVALGVAVLTIALGLAAAVAGFTQQGLAATYGAVDLAVVVEDGEGLVPAEVLGAARDTPGVGEAVGELALGVTVLDAAGTVADTEAVGAAWLGDSRLNPWAVVDGRAPEDPWQVAVERSVAEAAGVRMGDTLRLALAEQRVQSYEVVGLAEGPLGSPPAVLLEPEQAARELAGAGTVGFLAVLLALDDEATAGAVRQSLADRLAERPGDRAVALAVVDRAGLVETRAAAADNALLRGALLAFAGVAVFVAVFLVVNAFSITVTQRSRELALLRLVGASRRQVRGSVLLEALVVGVVASAVGLFGGVLAVIVLGLLAADAVGATGNAATTTATAGLTPGSLLVPPLVGVAVTLLAALGPARRASSLAPVVALRGLDDDRSGGRGRVLAGALLVGVGVLLAVVGAVAETAQSAVLVGAGAAAVFVAVPLLAPALVRPVLGRLAVVPARAGGVVGQLARDSVRSHPRRTAATASALVVGTGLVGAVLVFSETVNAANVGSVRADLLLSDLDGEPFPGSVVEQVAGLGGVSAVAATVPVTAEVAGERVELVGVEPEALAATVTTAEVAGDLTALAGDTIAVSRPVARSEGLDIGSVLTVRSTTGDERALTVVAHYEREFLLPDRLVPTEVAVALDPAATPTLSLVVLADGVDPLAGRSAVEAVAAVQAPGVLVEDVDERVARLAETTAVFTIVAVVLLVVSIAVALLGIVNALALSVLERVREIGLLRAVGMTRGQVGAAIRWEAGLVAGFGAVLGIVLGCATALALVPAAGAPGASDPVLPWGLLAVTIVVSVVAAVFAAALPARRAARLDVLDAIGYE